MLNFLLPGVTFMFSGNSCLHNSTLQNLIFIVPFICVKYLFPLTSLKHSFQGTHYPDDVENY